MQTITNHEVKKYIKAGYAALGENRKHVELLANIETITGYNNLDAMLEIPEISGFPELNSL